MDFDDVRTPLAQNAHYVEADNESDEDDDVVGFTDPSMGASPMTPQMPDKGKGRAREPDVLAPPGSSIISGNIGSSSTAPSRQSIGGVQVETRYTGADTLDEPISTTIARDLISIYHKLIQVLYPRRSTGREVLRDWDLWGPLVLCLCLGVMLSINAPADQSLGTFTSVIAICSIGALIVTVQAKLLGGRVSFFQGLCTLGYCLAPLNVAALISCFVRVIYIRAPIALLCWAWCIWAAVNFLDGTKIDQQRILLAVYPLLLFYFILAWMILIQ
ncbi:Yip1-domain-containing protein [Cylindrobasidium torrendii FP15055 ss-10]|uniref:Protein YIP n=1 Tax=Cylindrobasidium torrendii FP15055 ss-10 TaxID=1314674 RepID=A0A0D7B6N4_9AGAR|nr:Yip1-domain-containing protein [Cylindrobasidium torrendii FP15055 ss-10]